LGFTEVCHYAGGKQDWFASGLPREGRAARIPWIGDVAWREVPTCGLQDRVGDVRQRLGNGSEPVCVVVNEERVVLGLLRGGRLVAAGAATPAEAAMESGPPPLRPNKPLAEMARRMREKKQDHALITNGEGQLIGWLTHRAAEQALANVSGDSGEQSGSPKDG
jgi:CBS domain-containing protein